MSAEPVAETNSAKKGGLSEEFFARFSSNGSGDSYADLYAQSENQDSTTSNSAGVDEPPTPRPMTNDEKEISELIALEKENLEKLEKVEKEYKFAIDAGTDISLLSVFTEIIEELKLKLSEIKSELEQLRLLVKVTELLNIAIKDGTSSKTMAKAVERLKFQPKGGVKLAPKDVMQKKVTKHLCSTLQKELDKIRITRNFNPKEWIEKRCREFLAYFEKCKLKVAVISVSGGVDSSVITAILKYAQHMATTLPEYSAHPFNIRNGGLIVAVAQPIDSTPEIQNRAFELIETLFGITLDENKCYQPVKPEDVLGIHFFTVDQTFEHEIKLARFKRTAGRNFIGWASSMGKSYMRTVTAYMKALEYGGVVIGTGNLDEDGYLFYFCKFGDGAVDIGLIWDLHKSEVFMMGRYLGVPESILIAPPSADLAPGQTDENEIGSTYDMIELVYNYIQLWNNQQRREFLERISKDPEALKQFFEEKELIEAIHNRGLHKVDINAKNMGKYLFPSTEADEERQELENEFYQL
jgi:NAD+ synthase (glutamine-hydrolysing)